MGKYTGSFENYTDQLDRARQLGFDVVDYFIVPAYEVSGLSYDKLHAWVKGFDHECDGAVIRVNNNAETELAGTNSQEKWLNNVTALKFEQEKALAKVLGIEWSPGSKEYTPVVLIEPTQLEGAEVTRVSGHSIKNLIACEAVPGNEIMILRSGGVIPRMYHKSEYQSNL